MKTRDQLQEQYEDALFALIMDEFALSEGKRALEENERLNCDPAFSVPPGMERRCLTTISRCCAKANMKKAGRTAVKIVNKAAIVVLIAVLLFTTAFAAFPSFRADTLNLAIQLFDDRASFRVEEGNREADNSAAKYAIRADWLPDGFVFDRQEADSRRCEKIFVSSDGKRIAIAVMKLYSTVLNVDTENTEIEDVIIHGNTAVLAQKDGLVQLTWADEDRGILITVRATGVSKENTVKIAESLTIEIFS